MLTDLGRWFLPRLAAVVEDAVDYLLAFQCYVERWERLLDSEGEPVLGSSIDLDAVLEAL